MGLLVRALPLRVPLVPVARGEARRADRLPRRQLERLGGSAETFLSELPLPYPSYSDPDLNIAQDLGGPPQAFPTTTYYDRSGKQVFTHPGVYGSEADLVADVNKYAAGG